MWIEEIGSPSGLFSSYDSYADCGSNITCYRNQNELLYENFFDPTIYVGCDSVDEAVGIESERFFTASLQVFPNPASDFLTVQFSSPIFSKAEIQITDVLGRNLFTDQIKSDETKKISTGKFPDSLVFCQLWQNGELITTKKVLIQK